jgi:hypothetical protein
MKDACYRRIEIALADPADGTSSERDRSPVLKFVVSRLSSTHSWIKIVGMNFCGECGKDLRVAQQERFCGKCGREFLGPSDLRVVSGISKPSEYSQVRDAEAAYNAIKKVAIDLATRFSFNSTARDVANFHGRPPVHVEEDSEFDAFEDCSVSTDYTLVTFPLGDTRLPGVDLTYRFQKKLYRFYGAGEVNADGMNLVFLSQVGGLSLKRTTLQDVLGTPTESRMLDNFDIVDEWVLNTPSATKSKEKIIAYYEATTPDLVANMWVLFPEI